MIVTCSLPPPRNLIRTSCLLLLMGETTRQTNNSPNTCSSRRDDSHSFAWSFTRTTCSRPRAETSKTALRFIASEGGVAPKHTVDEERPLSLSPWRHYRSSSRSSCSSLHLASRYASASTETRCKKCRGLVNANYKHSKLQSVSTPALSNPTTSYVCDNRRRAVPSPR